MTSRKWNVVVRCLSFLRQKNDRFSMHCGPTKHDGVASPFRFLIIEVHNVNVLRNQCGAWNKRKPTPPPKQTTPHLEGFFVKVHLKQYKENKRFFTVYKNCGKNWVFFLQRRIFDLLQKLIASFFQQTHKLRCLVQNSCSTSPERGETPFPASNIGKGLHQGKQWRLKCQREKREEGCEICDSNI